MRTSAYRVHIAHQSDIHLTLISAQEHELSHESPTGAQFLTISVDSVREGVKPFSIRLVFQRQILFQIIFIVFCAYEGISGLLVRLTLH